MGVLDGLFGTSHKAMNKEGGGFLGKLLEALTGGGNKQQSFSPNQSYHRPSGENNNSGSGNSGNSSWGGSNIEKNKHDTFFSKNNTPTAFAVAGGYALGAAAGSVVHHAFEHHEEVHVPIVETHYIDHEFREFHPASDVAAEAGFAAGIVLPFLAELVQDNALSPSAVDVAMGVQKTQGNAVAV